MDRTNAAEWILRRVVGSSRAAELVGDRIETCSGEGDLRFWLSISWLVVVFSFRTVAGLLAASIAGVLLSWTPFAFAFTRLYLIGIKSPGPLDPGRYLAISMLMWIVAVFSLVRFGFRSQLTRIGLMGALLSMLAVCVFWLPYGIAAISVGAVGFFSFWIMNAKNRRTLAVLLLALASGGLMMFLLIRIPLNPRHSYAVWMLIPELFALVVVECGMASFLHRKLLVETSSNAIGYDATA